MTPSADQMHSETLSSALHDLCVTIAALLTWYHTPNAEISCQAAQTNRHLSTAGPGPDAAAGQEHRSASQVVPPIGCLLIPLLLLSVVENLSHAKGTEKAIMRRTVLASLMQSRMSRCFQCHSLHVLRAGAQVPARTVFLCRLCLQIAGRLP